MTIVFAMKIIVLIAEKIASYGSPKGCESGSGRFVRGRDKPIHKRACATKPHQNQNTLYFLRNAAKDLQVAPQQRGSIAPACTCLQPCHLLALHRATRGDGRLVSHQPATEAHQDREPCCTPRPRIAFQLAEVTATVPNSARHPCRHPQFSIPSVMRVASKWAITERKIHHSTVRRASKRGHMAKATYIRGRINQSPSTMATALEANSERRLTWRKKHEINVL